VNTHSKKQFPQLSLSRKYADINLWGKRSCPREAEKQKLSKLLWIITKQLNPFQPTIKEHLSEFMIFMVMSLMVLEQMNPKANLFVMANGVVITAVVP
jgi:hypothetical protein